MPKQFKTTVGGKELVVEIGRFAEQANGAVTLTYGGTVVLATAVMSKHPRVGGGDFFPLLVDFEERLYAAGKIKGSRFVKREGRATDEAILTARFIDRSIRPRFNQRMRHDVQIVVTVLSIDGENDPDILGILGASLALSLSNIPWSGPIAGVRVGIADGALKLNPTYTERDTATLDLAVSGVRERVNMIEAGASEVPEEKLLEALGFAHKEIQALIAFQEEIIRGEKPKKTNIEIPDISPELEAFVKERSTSQLEKVLYEKDKMTRQEKLHALKEETLKAVEEKYPNDTAKTKEADHVFEEEISRIVHENVLKHGKRPDGRKPDELREIRCEVGVLPRTHGSAVFMRGNTQALGVLTLGAPGAKQIIENIEEAQEFKKRFILHYNFPPYSVGEVAPMRGPGRREIGHGALAERALLPLIPQEEPFPYTMRLVSEILSSNGSSSMASVCSCALALMDGGVPIKAPAAGIAMGLMTGPGDMYKVLTDIQGPEDHHGDMDLKVAGTREGVTALQMDVKIEGVTLEMLQAAFAQARDARLQILDTMREALPEPRKDLSPYAPRIVTLLINPERIRNVIGPGGKTINEIIDATGVEIDIEDDGHVFITSTNPDAAAKAVDWVKNLTREAKPGELFQGKVTRIMDFGAFVEILPKQEGMVHISELAPFRVGRVEDIVHVGDQIPVVVREIDAMGRINLSLKAAREMLGEPQAKKPEGYDEQQAGDFGDAHRRARPMRPDRGRKPGYGRPKIYS